MAALRFTCPTCRETLQGGEALRGKQVRCPKCQNKFAIPAAPAKAAPPVEEDAVGAGPPPARKKRPAPPPAGRKAPAAAAPKSFLRSYWPWLAGCAGLALVLFVVGVVGVIALVKAWTSPVTLGGPVAVVAPGPAGGPPPVAGVVPAGNGLDLTYVTANFDAAAVLRPWRLLESPVGKTLSEKTLADMMRETGIDAHKVELAIVLLEPNPGSGPATQNVVKADPSWKKFTSGEGRYSVRFPAQPKLTRKKGKGGSAGEAAAELPGGVRYAVQFEDVGQAAAADPGLMLDTVFRQFGPDARIKQEIKLDGNPGLELKAENGPAVVAIRVFLVGQRLYLLTAAAPKERQDQGQAGLFFDSFHLLGGPGPRKGGPGPGAVRGNREPVLPSVILRFSEPVDGRAILTKALGPLVPKEAGDKEYFLIQDRQKEDPPPAGHVADGGKTLLIAPEPTLRKMLAGTAASSPLIERLKQTDPKCDAVAVFMLEPYMKLAAAAGQPGGPGLPPEFTKLVGLSDRLKAVTVTVNLEGAALVKAEVETTGPEAAAELHKALDGGLDLLRKAYPQMRGGLAAQLPPEAAPPVLAVADQLNGGVTVAQDGARVNVSVRRPEGLLDAKR